MDLKQYQSEFYKKTKGFSGLEILKHYEYPNSEELHTMICGYVESFDDMQLFDRAESIDYFKYERQLWRDSRRNW